MPIPVSLAQRLMHLMVRMQGTRYGVNTALRVHDQQSSTEPICYLSVAVDRPTFDSVHRNALEG